MAQFITNLTSHRNICVRVWRVADLCRSSDGGERYLPKRGKLKRMEEVFGIAVLLNRWLYSSCDLFVVRGKCSTQSDGCLLVCLESAQKAMKNSFAPCLWNPSDNKIIGITIPLTTNPKYNDSYQENQYQENDQRISFAM